MLPGNLGKTTRAILAMAGNPASVSCDFLFSSRDSQLAQDMSNQKQTGVLPGKDPCHGRHYALNYFVNLFAARLSRSVARFQHAYFLGTQPFSSNALPFFLAYARQHLPMPRLRPRLAQTMCLRRPPDSGPAWPGGLDSPIITVLLYFIRRRFHHVRASCLLLQPSLEVLLSISNG